jgi:hypothetical protein
MAAVTALILVGVRHPNEHSHDPRWILRLWEGDSAVWTATQIGSSEPVESVRPGSPHEILESGCSLASNIATEHGCSSVLVTALEDSSIVDQLDRVASLLSGVELHVMRSI